MKEKKFKIQVLSKGNFIDTESGDDGNIYQVEATVIRLNRVALNEWILSGELNDRCNYNTVNEWEEYKKEKEKKRELVKTKIIDTLCIDKELGGIQITQSLSEIFTVVHIWEIKNQERKY